ncbi:MAG: methyltransferase domain-containing protein [Acidobacteria bacterium]|nr:methyltransferase domain-containing protein [Acidobacteriota bacterium]
MLRQPGRLFGEATASFYTSRTPYAADPAVPLWSNLGYWAEARTAVDAQIELARLLGRSGRLAAGDELLDVGCGCGDQDLLWLREWNLKRIVAIDVTPLRVELARARVARAGLADRIDVRVGTATELPFGDRSFDKITALECATHFNSREDFLREAHRVLRPGGRLALTDFTPLAGSPPSPADRLLQRLARRLIGIPAANVYPAASYAARLWRIGFERVEIRSIADHVFPGCMRYRAMLAAGRSSSAVVEMEARDFVASQWNSAWHDGLGLGDYILVTADKPRIPTSPAITSSG